MLCLSGRASPFYKDCTRLSPRCRSSTPPALVTLSPSPKLTVSFSVPRHSLEKNSTALHKEAKAYLDSVRQISASSTRIGATMDLFYGSDAGEQAMSANAYKRAVEEWESSVARGIVSALD